MHSEGILAGELKHGPLALVDKLMPVIMIIMRDHTYNKCQNALQQVVARQVRTTHIPPPPPPPPKYLEKLIFLGHTKEKYVIVLSVLLECLLFSPKNRKKSGNVCFRC